MNKPKRPATGVYDAAANTFTPTGGAPISLVPVTPKDADYTVSVKAMYDAAGVRTHHMVTTTIPSVKTGTPKRPLVITHAVMPVTRSADGSKETSNNNGRRNALFHGTAAAEKAYAAAHPRSNAAPRVKISEFRARENQYLARIAELEAAAAAGQSSAANAGRATELAAMPPVTVGTKAAADTLNAKMTRAEKRAAAVARADRAAEDAAGITAPDAPPMP